MSNKPERRPSEPEDDLLLDEPVLKLAVLVWTVGIFAIAIVLARAGWTTFGLLVIVGGALIGIFAFWEPLKELYQWLRRQDGQR